MRDPHRASTNVSTERPETTPETNQKNKPFRTRANIPSVRMLIGKVKILIIGFMIVWMKNKTAPAITAGSIPTTSIPGTKYAAAITASININHLKNIFIPLEIANY